MKIMQAVVCNSKDRQIVLKKVMITRGNL